MTDLRVIDGKADAPPATYEQIVVFEFGDVKRLKRMSKEERIASLHAMATRISPAYLPRRSVEDRGQYLGRQVRR